MTNLQTIQNLPKLSTESVQSILVKRLNSLVALCKSFSAYS